MSLTEETTLDRPELRNERLEIPSMAEDEIKTKVTGLNKSFTKLLQSLKKELKEKDVTEIVEFLEDSGCDHLPFDDLKTSNNFRELLTKVGDYYDFLDCELLKMIAEEYASEELAESFEVHSSEAQKFRESNSVHQLRECLQQIFNPYVDDLEKGPKAYIDLNSAWDKMTLNRLRILIRCFFPDSDPLALTKHINVTCSSVHITYFMTESPDQIQQVIAWAKERVAFMKYIGLYRLVINGETILDESEKEDFSFNSALIEAARVGQSEAVEVLLQLGSGSDVLGNISQALLDACDNGHYCVVKLLLDEKADSNVQKECGRTALYLASRNGHHKVVELLLKAKADPNIQSLEGVTPLYMASQNGHPQVVELLLQKKADTNVKVIANGMTALMAASHCGNNKIVELLLKEKVDPNVQNNDGFTALMLASVEGHQQVVKLLLDAKTDPNIREKKLDCTALMLASLKNCQEVVELLLRNEADPNISYHGMTVLMLASFFGNVELVELLLKNKVDPNVWKSKFGTALILASAKGHQQVVKLLLDAKADRNIRGENGCTALILAILGNHQEVVELLLRNEVDPNISAIDDGMMALMVASHCGHIKIVEIFLKEKVNLNIQDYDVWTALILASLENHQEVVELLLNANPNPNIREEDGWTALITASSNGCHQVVELLLNANVDPNIKENDGWTALMIASQEGHYQVVRLLLERNADPNIMSENGCTAIVIASQNGHLPVVELLFKENADPNLQKGGRTALVLASLNNQKDVVSFLIKEQEDHGLTALMSAIYSKHIDIVLSLLETGIMTYVDQVHIQAAIKFSMMHSNTEIMERLRYYATDVHSFSEEDLSSSEIHTIISAIQVESQDIDSVNTLPYSNKEIGRILMQDTDEDSLIKNAPARYQKHPNQLAAGESYQPSFATSQWTH